MEANADRARSADSAVPHGTRRGARAAAAAVAGLAAFVATLGLVHAALPWPPAAYPLLARKVAAYDAADPVDVAFFGSSVVYRGIDPAVVERRLAEHGIAARVFNFGLPAMRAFETDDLLRSLAANGRTLPPWTVVEAGDWDPRRSGGEFLRDVAWHSPRQTRRALSLTLDADLAPGATLALAGRHVRAFLLRLGRVGYAPPLLARELSPEPADDAEAEFVLAIAPRTAGAWRGHAPLHADRPAATEALAERRRAFLEDPDAYRDAVRSLSETPPPRLAPRAAVALAAQARFLRARGSRPVRLAGPSIRHAPRPPDDPAGTPFLAFDDPAAFPELYDAERRFDGGHLDAVGAAVWSALVADRLAPLLAAGER